MEQRDLELMSLSSEKLDEILDASLRKLGSNVGMTYDQRCSLAGLVCRVLIEQNLRDYEARAPRGPYPRRDR